MPNGGDATVTRLESTLCAFRVKFGEWPSRLVVQRGMWPVLAHYLSPEQLGALLDRVQTRPPEPNTPAEGWFIAEGEIGRLAYREASAVLQGERPQL
jgi:hypothetical protein